MTTSKPLKIIYMLLHFPRLTETFVAEEIDGLRRQGVDIQIISLLPFEQTKVQPLSQKLQKETWYAPEVTNWQGWRAQLYFLRHNFSLYWMLLFGLLRAPYPTKPHVLFAKRLVIFFKAVAAAHWLKTDHADADLIHAHFAWLPGAAAWLCSRLLSRPYTVTAHAYDIFQATDLLGLVCRNAKHVVTISEYNRQHILQLGLCADSSISVIRCGVHFYPLEESTDQPPADHPIRLISVGRLSIKKGFPYLIEACRQLRENNVNFTCTIIGTGAMHEELAQQIRDSQLDQRVKLLGARLHPEILQAYRNHDIFAMAACVAPNGDRDGIPVALMEAAASGLPLVSTQVSGIPELVHHEHTGLLVAPESPHALADAIEKLAFDFDMRRRLGRNAFVLAQNEFNLSTNVSRLYHLFHEQTATIDHIHNRRMAETVTVGSNVVTIQGH